MMRGKQVGWHGWNMDRADQVLIVDELHVVGGCQRSHLSGEQLPERMVGRCCKCWKIVTFKADPFFDAVLPKNRS